MAETESPIKRPRGNPNFLKKKQENNTNNTMADEKEEPKKDKAELNEKGEDVTQETPPPAPDTLPEDLFSDKMPGEEILPLDGLVKTKDYASLPVDAVEATSTSSDSKPSGDATSSTPVAPVVPPPTPEEIKSQAEQTAELLIKGYEKLHAIGRWYGKVNQSNLTQMHAKGKINLEQVLPIGKKSITVGGFFEEYNQSIDTAIIVEQDYKDKVKPALVRECIKRGWLMNDLLYIMVLTGNDLSAKLGILIGMKKSSNLVLNACQEMMKNQREQKEGKKTPPPPADNSNPPTEDSVEWHEAEDGNPSA